jgi:hypothetical protein
MMVRIKLAHRALAQKYPYEIRLAGDGASGTLVFQPRDGTRYVIVFRPVESSDEARELGCTAPETLISVMQGSNKYVSAVFDHAPHRTYLEEKLGVSPHAARQIQRALSFLFDEVDPGPFAEVG